MPLLRRASPPGQTPGSSGEGPEGWEFVQGARAAATAQGTHCRATAGAASAASLAMLTQTRPRTAGVDASASNAPSATPLVAGRDTGDCAEGLGRMRWASGPARAGCCCCGVQNCLDKLLALLRRGSWRLGVCPWREALVQRPGDTNRRCCSAARRRLARAAFDVAPNAPADPCTQVWRQPARARYGTTARRRAR